MPGVSMHGGTTMEKLRDDEVELLRLLAANIRAVRAFRGLRQEEMAELAGMHRNYWGGVERAQRNISLGSLVRLAEALGCEPHELLQPGGPKLTVLADNLSGRTLAGMCI